MARSFRGGFRTVHPNVIGWVALLAPGAILGGGISWLFDFRIWIGAIVGAVFIWRVALYLDFRKEGGLDVTYVIDVGNLAELDQITARLRTIGVPAEGREVSTEGGLQFHLIAKHRDRAMVESEIGWV